MARKTQVQYINFYTAGSAAIAYEPAHTPKKQEAKLPRPRRQKRIRVCVDPMAVLGICVAVVMLVMMTAGLVRLNTAQTQASQMAGYVERLNTENAQLRATYEAGYDSDEIYQIATAMGMVPADQAQHVTIQVNVPEAQSEPTAWENFCVFLTGLFA